MADTSFDALVESFSAWPETFAATDAMHLKGEHDPRTRGTGHFIYVLDTIPDWDRFVAVWDRASRILPPHAQTGDQVIGAGQAAGVAR